MSSFGFYPIRGSSKYGLVADGTPIPKAARFIRHDGVSRTKLEKPLSQLDQFAELLSEGLSVAQAASRMGFGYDYGNAMLQRIRRKLGPQAI